MHGRNEKPIKICVRIFEGNRHPEDLGVDGRKILL